MSTSVANRPSGWPATVAIIMDGNGRWAQSRGLPRTAGHRAGITSVREVTTACAELGIVELTLYAFSTENWKRPRAEVAMLMTLLRRFLMRERETIMSNQISLRAIGELERLPARVKAELDSVIALSAGNRGMILRLALSYGGRQEIVRAAQALAARAARGELVPAAIDEATFAGELWDATMRDPDLMVRTAGEMRLSNFLLWQASYAELYVTPRCWPEFRRPELLEAFDAYSRRQRKFGGLKA